mmetsp:Transcript_1590/g.2954  ORF Transcript_1590/g.2954 Transcript_1590/m.2954 type:complete len:429 (-) Transcript_1590:113-1399(-)
MTLRKSTVPRGTSVNSTCSVLAVLLMAYSYSLVAEASPSADSVTELDCDAFASQEAKRQQQLAPTAIATVEASPSSAPSDAPSAAPLCSDRLSNARGVYTATHAPCTIKFHSVSNVQRENEEREVDFIDYRTSDLCRDDTVIIEIKDYLRNWADECVSDFERCYSLDHHKFIYPSLCLPDEEVVQGTSNNSFVSYHHRWEIPPSTTHISVDCTVDKEVGHQTLEEQERNQRKEVRDARREEIAMKLFNWVLVFLSSLTIIYALSHFIVMPLVTVAGRNRRRKNERRRTRNNSRRSRTLRTSGSSLSSSYGDLPLHYLPQEHVTLIAGHEVVVEGSAVPLNNNNTIPQGECDGDHDHSDSHSGDDQDDSEGSSDDYSYSYDEEQRNLNDFDSQVPCDFDAVPIVAATVLHASAADVVPATVVDDGVSYS